MKTLLVFLVAALAALPVSGQSKAADEVPAWEGVWEGELINIPPNPPFDGIHVTSELGKFPTVDDTCSLFRNTYKEGTEVKQVKNYKLCRGTGPSDLFIDENNGLKLPARLFGGMLVTPFKYGETIFVSIMRLEGETLIEDIHMIEDKPSVKGALPLVPKRVQRLSFRRAEKKSEGSQ